MVRDSMTGLFNHTATNEQLEAAIAEARSNGRNLCYATIDADRFKQINDTYGHPAGDKVLVTLSRLLRQRLRKSDIVGRLGGEEFAAILPDCDISTAVSLLDEIRESFASIRFPAGAETFSLTFSCGISSLSEYEYSGTLCKAADDALSAAKREGRNRIVTAGSTSDKA